MTSARDRVHLTRRRVLRDAGVGVLGITAMGTLVACGNGDDQTASTGEPGDGGPDGTSTEPTTEATTEATTEPTDPSADVTEAPPADALAAVDDIPVGGAISATASGGAEIILARPSDTEVVGFSAVCTHQACTVAPADDRIQCPCHGSVYDLLTGENVSGPAPSPLESFAVQVTGGAVVEA